MCSCRQHSHLYTDGHSTHNQSNLKVSSQTPFINMWTASTETYTVLIPSVHIIWNRATFFIFFVFYSDVIDTFWFSRTEPDWKWSAKLKKTFRPKKEWMTHSLRTTTTMMLFKHSLWCKRGRQELCSSRPISYKFPLNRRGGGGDFFLVS